MQRLALGLFTAWAIAGAAATPAQAVAALALPPAAPPSSVPPAASLPSAARIIEKNAAARGGVDAWRRLAAVAWSGRVETGNAARATLPFVLEQKRPDKTRFEITVDQQKSVRIFDGSEGWKLRPSSTGRPEVVAYTAEEANYAREAQVIDGPLMDDAAKGYPVTVEALDDVEGHPAYRLSARLPSGTVQKLWIDAATFLELRLDRSARDSGGRPFVVSVYFRNYKAVEGLQIPLALETRIAGVNGAETTDRLVIERVALNPTLEDRLFSKPGPPGVRRGVIVDTRAATGGRSRGSGPVSGPP
jgi:hypothetical protein